MQNKSHKMQWVGKQLFHFRDKKCTFHRIADALHYAVIRQQQSGAVEACWAHNPEVRGSKPRSASNFFLTKAVFKSVLLAVYLFSIDQFQGKPCNRH